MTEWRSSIAERWDRGRWFVAALLLALASALVPALCASGLPSTRATGSAFDPATSVVALRGRTQALIRAETVHDGAATGTAAVERGPLPLAILAAMPRPAIQAASAYPSRASHFAPAPRVQARRITRAQPRAPPLLTA